MEKNVNFVNHLAKAINYEKNILFIIGLLGLLSCNNEDGYKPFLKEHEKVISSDGGFFSIEGNQRFSFAEIIEIIDEKEIVQDLSSENEFKFEGKWYSLWIEGQKMFVEIKENETGKKRSLQITVHHTIFDQVNIFQSE